MKIVPANEASWEDLSAIFGTADYPGRCQCQRFMVPGWIWRDTTQEQRTAMLRTQTRRHASGLRRLARVDALR